MVVRFADKFSAFLGADAGRLDHIARPRRMKAFSTGDFRHDVHYDKFSFHRKPPLRHGATPQDVFQLPL